MTLASLPMTIKFTGKVSDFLKIGVAHAARGDIDAVRQILNSKPNWVHKVGSHGRTMLWEACHRGRLPMVKYLIRRKADINACGSYYTPYFVEISCYCIARFKGHDDVANYLVEKGAIIDIHTAAFLGEHQRVKEMLKRNRSLVNSGHPQHEMAESGTPGPDLILADAPWATPLCYALRGGDVATVEYLIRKKSKIRGFEEYLFEAANDVPALVSLLLENGADPEHAPQATPDDQALFDVVQKYGVGLPSRDQLGEELVYLCRGDRGGNPKEVERLISLGAPINHQDHKGKTAMHRAAKAGFVETLKVLLKHKAKINIPDHALETPVFEAVRSTIKDTERKLETIRLLIKAKAKLKLTNRKGLTVLDVAQRSKLPERRRVINLLK